jgi:hypothetical protein
MIAVMSHLVLPVCLVTRARPQLGTLSRTIDDAVDEEANGKELDPTVLPIGAEIRSQSGDLIGRAREVHTRYLVLEDGAGGEIEIPVESILQIEGKRVVIDESVIDTD